MLGLSEAGCDLSRGCVQPLDMDLKTDVDDHFRNSQCKSIERPDFSSDCGQRTTFFPRVSGRLLNNKEARRMASRE